MEVLTTDPGARSRTESPTVTDAANWETLRTARRCVPSSRTQGTTTPPYVTVSLPIVSSTVEGEEGASTQPIIGGPGRSGDSVTSGGGVDAKGEVVGAPGAPLWTVAVVAETVVAETIDVEEAGAETVDVTDVEVAVVDGDTVVDTLDVTSALSKGSRVPVPDAPPSLQAVVAANSPRTTHDDPTLRILRVGATRTAERLPHEAPAAKPRWGR